MEVISFYNTPLAAKIKNAGPEEPASFTSYRLIFNIY